MITYGEFSPTAFDPKGLGLREQQDWLVAPISRTRDSGPLDQSNFATGLEMLGGESDTVEVHRFGHWGPGWFELVLIDPSDTDRVAVAEEMERSLEDYPVLDEMDMSEREHEDAMEAWENWYAGEFRDKLKAIHSLGSWRYSDGPEDGDSLEDRLDDVLSGDLYDLYQSVDGGYETGSDGAHFEIDGPAEAVTLPDLRKFLDTVEKREKEQA